MRIPVFWVAVAYGAGLALYTDVNDSPRVLFLLALLALLLGSLALGRRWERGRLPAALACALAGFFFLGGATIGLVAADVSPTRGDRLLASEPIDLSEAVRLTGWLRRAPEPKPFATFYALELEALETGGRRYSANGGVRLSYFGSRDPEHPESLPAVRYGDRVEVLARLHRPLNHQTPGSFDWEGHLARRDIFLEGPLKSSLLLAKLPDRRGNLVLGWIYGLRTNLLARLDQLIPPATQSDRNAVLRAMLLGDTGFLQHRQGEPFRRSGAYHVLVISGLHVGIIAFVIFWLLRQVTGNDWLITALTIAALVFYLLLVEDRPPIERAVWMVSLYLVARLLFRQVHPANPTALAALLVLFLHPLWLFEPSFHLSFGAVFLMAFFAVPWMERTSAPYRNALGSLDAEERDDLLRSPRLAQFRLDLRLLAALLAGAAFWTQEKEPAARRLLTRGVRLGLRVWDFFLLSFAIQLGFLLLSALYFRRVVWVGLLTNILVVPLVGWIVPVGLGGLLLSLVWLPAGALVARLTSLLTGWLLAIVDTLGTRGLSYGIPPPPPWVVGLYLAALILLGIAVTYQRRQRWPGLALAALILVVATFPFSPQLPPATLEVTALDVGQGDSLFIAFPNRETWLVDAGRGPTEIRPGYTTGEAVGETVVLPYLRSRGLKRLDHLWLTHAHLDHMGGLPALLDDMRVGSVHVGRNPPSPPYQNLLQKIRQRGIPLREHAAGERFQVGEVQVEVLWPPLDYKPGREPANNDSLVLRLCPRPAGAGWAGTCVLLPGDIEDDVERKLAREPESGEPESGEPAPLAAAVLKVPHHGGRDAATPEFLAAVQPRVAIISVGATNPFGHPFDDVLARLAARDERVYRTDRDGSVTVRLSAGGLRVETFRQQQRAAPYPNLWARLAACARLFLPLE